MGEVAQDQGVNGSGGALAWRMVLIGFLAQNCAVNLASGVYGTLLPILRRDLHVSSALASSAMGAMLLSIGLLAPVVGSLLQKMTIRMAMSIGAVLVGIGYVVAALAEDIYLIIGAFALLIGPGACLMGPISVSTLVSRWFPQNRGKALALANMPLFLLIAPPFGGFLATRGGHELVFGALAFVFVLILPLLQLIREPDTVDVIPGGKGQSADDRAGIPMEPAGKLGAVAYLKDHRFWALSLGIGVFTAAGIIFVTHSVAIAVQSGVDFSQAPSVVSSFGAGTLAGAILFGWMIDRIGAVPSLLLNTLSQAALWILVLFCGDLLEFVIVAFVIGCGIGATVALHGAVVNVLFGVTAFSQIMGSSYFIKIPFLFGAAPLAGYIFDETGTYDAALFLISGSFVITAFLVLSLGKSKGALFPAGSS